ncbi:hypothetical protein [Bacteroides sp. GM023]|uniref:hypothetical protein n=1 Tax=Bacteroides sp. GM023 TaxID=2723058 RepID=UPI00168B3411|nr:hypothetical protein [Bacteroides sp. GM023]MBD3591495.1 hypothetical protein [Bacteroides sp. GM023]
MIVDIKDVTGNIRFSTPINKGSKRKFTLMQEDYITLKFSLDHPVYFNLGDGIDNELGIFELIDLYKPVYNAETGGYNYELRLDAYYWKWKNKKFFYTPESIGREASWNLTAPLKTHLEVFVANLNALGYRFREQEFIPKIDDTVEQSSKLVSYDNTNLIDALTQMAEVWECEWWMEDKCICFGRCEFSSPIDFKVGDLTDTENVNVNSMQRSDSQSTYATRIYAFGSTRNIPSTYRKNLIFDVKTVNGRDISDTARGLDTKFFPISATHKKEYSTSDSERLTGLDRDVLEWSRSKTSLYEASGGVYQITSEGISAVVKSYMVRSGMNFISTRLPRGNYLCKARFSYQLNGVQKEIHIGSQTINVGNDSTYEVRVTFNVPNRIEIEKGATQLCVEVYGSVPAPWIPEAKIFPSAIYKLKLVSAPFTNALITFLSGGNAGRTFDSVYNPDLLTGDNANVIRLPEGITASISDKYIIANIIKGKVPDSYFSKDDKEMTLNGVVQKRLMLPEDVPYVDAYRYSPTGERIDIGDEHYDDLDNVEMPEEEAVEEVITFDDEYPKYIGNTEVVPEPIWKDVIDEETEKPTGNRYPVYTFKDKDLKNFTEDFRFKDKDLTLIFQTGKLSGLEFVINIEESDATGTTFKIIRNDNYGRYLPDDTLFPQAVHVENGKDVPADTYILSGFDTAFISEQMLPDSEQRLFETAKKYIKKSMIDPSTYNCEMVPEFIYNNGNLRIFEVGDKVNLINKAYFKNGRQSRVIGFEWPLDIPYDHPIYTVGETAAYSRLGAIESKVDSLTYKGQTYSGISINGGGGTSVYVIGINDKTLPSDRNTFSSKRIINEIKACALSKINDDEATGLISFSKGLISEELIEANNGLVVRRQEIMEVFPMALVEEDDALVEELSVKSDAMTLGEIINVSKEVDEISATNDLIVRLSGALEWTVNTTLFSNVSKLMGEVFPFTMSFTGGAKYEKGSMQTINLSWSYDRDIISQSINRETIAVDVRTKQYEGIVADTTYTLSAIFDGQTYTKSTSVEFRLKKYYGVSVREMLTDEEALALPSLWAGRAQTSTVFDCTGGKFPYYILPTSMVAGIQFWIGGLRNSDWIEEVREITNAYGYTESYTVFRLNSIQTGVLNIEIK